MSQIRERWPPQGLPGAIQSGTLANRPVAGSADIYYWATDIVTLFRDTGAAWEVVGAQWYQRYIDTVFGHGSESFGAPAAADRVYYSPIIIQRTVTIDRIGISSNTTSGNLYMAIYDSTGEIPDNRLRVSASTAVAGAKQQLAFTAGSIQLIAGYYFLAFVNDNILDRFSIINSDVLGRLPQNVNHGPSFHEEQLGSYVAPPAVAASDFSGTYNKQYYMWVRVSSIP